MHACRDSCACNSGVYCDLSSGHWVDGIRVLRHSGALPFGTAGYLLGLWNHVFAERPFTLRDREPVACVTVSPFCFECEWVLFIHRHCRTNMLPLGIFASCYIYVYECQGFLSHATFSCVYSRVYCLMRIHTIKGCILRKFLTLCSDLGSVTRRHDCPLQILSFDSL